VKNSFTTISDCLNYWEFCPLCDKRNEISIKTYTDLNKTIITNDEIIVSNYTTNIININLMENKFPNLENLEYIPLLQLYCKSFHFSIHYKFQEQQLDLEKLFFFITDKKNKSRYHILSDYSQNKTDIQLSSQEKAIYETSRELVNFNSLSSKYIIKRIRALCLLD